ncbi:hypothetical protein WCX49_08335 [Sulfurimonas sp. HSL-1656]|uniref:hypothetical protein n=1 Tax=Thiomicrolovo subterrani TaxID=3131934 RepID=UPI0031F9526C
MNFNTERLQEIAAALDPFETGCAVTVALKISDDTCKMSTEQKALFMALYDALPEKKCNLFENDVTALIAAGRSSLTEEITAQIKPLREFAMDKITRPKMKAFKADIRKRYAA